MLLLGFIVACASAPPLEPPVPATNPGNAALVDVLQHQLYWSERRLDRAQTAQGERCAVVLDPADPSGCMADATCRGVGLSATGERWTPRRLASAAELTKACVPTTEWRPLRTTP